MNVTVTFAEHPELFVEKYVKVPNTYTVALPVKSTFFTDLEGNDFFSVGVDGMPAQG